MDIVGYFKDSLGSSWFSDALDDPEIWPDGIKQNFSILSTKEKELVKLLLRNQQHHLFEKWETLGINDEKKHSFFNQVERLHNSYPAKGGLGGYITNARELLRSSRAGENPLDGWTPQVPTGVTLDPLSTDFFEYEKVGLEEVGRVGFILVAGGLGERLGYNGIKVELPTETTTKTSYLELYCKSILAIQSRYNHNSIKIPLAIMLSDDTYNKTVDLLVRNSYYGLDKDQITLMKQEKVASLIDNEAHIALVSNNPYEIESKPHGHGDVHALMYSTGTAMKWLEQGIRWCFFFQDTNGLAFITLPAQLGVSIKLDLEVNSMTVPRLAKQAVGGITRLVHSDGRVVTVNVEYNQLEPLLLANGFSGGDINDPNTGFSPFPGNINQLIFRLDPYVANLREKSGIMSEFVNPKYADKERTTFKKPTRLECMMQDYPKSLGKDSKVGFTSAPAWICFSPCKNNSSDAAIAFASGIPANSAFTAESDQYYATAEVLRRLGARIPSAKPLTFLGITAIPGPQIVLKPTNAIFPSEISARFPFPSKVSVSSNSTLIIEGNVVIENIVLTGFLHIIASPGTKLIVRAGKWGGVSNSGQVITKLSNSNANEVDLMRGYEYIVKRKVVIATPEVVTARARMIDSTDSVINVKADVSITEFPSQQPNHITYVYNGRSVIPRDAYDTDDEDSEVYQSKLPGHKKSCTNCFLGVC